MSRNPFLSVSLLKKLLLLLLLLSSSSSSSLLLLLLFSLLKFTQSMTNYLPINDKLSTTSILENYLLNSSYLFKYSDIVSIIIISEINHSFGFVSFHILTQPIKCYIPLLHSSGLSPARFVT